MSLNPENDPLLGVWTILVVDDDELIVELLKVRLEVRGFHVVTASNGEQAYSVLKSEKPHLIVCDVVMPRVDGLSFCRKVRSEGLAIPFLFLTAKGQPHDIVEVLSAGADDYVIKPFNAGELAARIAAILRRFYPNSAA